MRLRCSSGWKQNWSAFRRNWRADDKLKRRRIYLVKYDFIPGQGFYGIGLIHLIGGLQAAATGTLRELIEEVGRGARFYFTLERRGHG